MPSCKPERRIASSRLRTVCDRALFQPGRFALASSGSGKIAFSATIPGRYPFLSLNCSIFCVILIALFFADAGKFARESTRRARSITGPSTILPLGKPRRGLRERRLQRLLRRGGVIHFFLGRCVEVVQQINLTGLISDLPSKPSCLMWAASCRIRLRC